MRVLITGANGQLGTDLVERAAASPDDCHRVLATTRKTLDITDAKQVKEVVERFHPHAVIHTAAYTAVDAAQTDVVSAYAVNADGTKNVAAAAEKIGAKFMYLSTDYVFDGFRAHGAYGEYDAPSPRSVYGQSKLTGEHLTETLCSQYFIVRTAWVYGLHGNNFVKTMLRLGQEQIRLRNAKETYGRLKVVDDQIGSPTYTVDLAGFLWELIETHLYGIYHATNRGSCSWYQFAKAIFEEADLPVEVDACTTEEFPRPAPRPRNSVLGHTAMAANGFTPLRPWRRALREFIRANWRELGLDARKE